MERNAYHTLPPQTPQGPAHHDRKFNLSTKNVTASGSITMERGCNTATFINTGDNIVTVNDVVLYPGTPGTSVGDSFTFGGNQDEVFAGFIKVAFQSVSAGQQLTIIQKYYGDYQ